MVEEYIYRTNVLQNELTMETYVLLERSEYFSEKTLSH